MIRPRGRAGDLVELAMIASLAMTLATGGHAAADPLADPKIEKADLLYAEGRALLSSNLLQACAKFDESLRYNAAAIGTILNVALCNEKLGRVATAVARFTEARERAKEQGLPEHMRAADEHIAALAPEVPHLAIKLTETLPETSVLLDDQVVAPAALGDVAVDPGERTVVVSAPNRLPFRTKLVINKAEHKDLVIPALARSIVITSSHRRIGQITTLAGAVTAGTGLGLGLYARQLYNQQFDAKGESPAKCTSDAKGDRCNADGLTQTHRARTLGNVATIVGAAGLVATGVGVYLWLRAPSSTTELREPAVSVVPSIGPDGLGVAALGRF